MPLHRIHRSPRDGDEGSSSPGKPSKPRRGLFGGLSSTNSDPAPWEVDTVVETPAVSPPPPRVVSRHDRDAPTSARLRVASKARMAAVAGKANETDISKTFGRLRAADGPSEGRPNAADATAAAPSADGATYLDDPWAAATGGKPYEEGVVLPPLAAPVPPDPMPDSFAMAEAPLGADADESTADSPFDSDSFWGGGQDYEETVPDVQLAPPSAADDGFLAGDFDPDVGFTHDSVVEKRASDWGPASFDDLALATPVEVDDDGPALISGGDPFDHLAEPAQITRRTQSVPPESADSGAAARPLGTSSGHHATSAPPTFAHDMSYPDIPTLTVEDALKRGRELLADGQAEDALAVLEMGRRIDSTDRRLAACLEQAEDKVLGGILPNARADRSLALTDPESSEAFADPRDAALVRSLAEPRSFAALRAEHSMLSMREFAGRVSAMLSMRVFRWDD